MRARARGRRRVSPSTLFFHFLCLAASFSFPINAPTLGAFRFARQPRAREESKNIIFDEDTVMNLYSPTRGVGDCRDARLYFRWKSN